MPQSPAPGAAPAADPPPATKRAVWLKDLMEEASASLAGWPGEDPAGIARAVGQLVQIAEALRADASLLDELGPAKGVQLTVPLQAAAIGALAHVVRASSEGDAVDALGCRLQGALASVAETSAVALSELPNPKKEKRA